MTLTDAMARITEIRGLVDPQASTSASAPPSTASTVATAASFQQLLAASTDGSDDDSSTGLSTSSMLDTLLGSSATGTTGTGLTDATGLTDTTGLTSLTGLTGLTGLTAPLVTGGATGPAGTTATQRMVAAAEGEVGQTEQPPGSNDSPRIAEYRTATSGSGVGPWCAYFTSWAAQQAGIPLGEAGQGFGSVDAVTQWAQRTGRFMPAGTATPQAGDLITWGSRHIGIVESVDADGAIHTIEGNSSNAVSRRTYGSDGGGATGFVRLGQKMA
jgi:CHAP domain